MDTQEAVMDFRCRKDVLVVRNPDPASWTAYRRPSVSPNRDMPIWSVIRETYNPFLTDAIVASNLSKLVYDKRIVSDLPDVARMLGNLLLLQQRKEDELDRAWNEAQVDAIDLLLDTPDESLICERDTGWHDYLTINRAKAPWFFPPYMMDPECIREIGLRFSASHPVAVKLARIVERIDRNNEKYNLRIGD